LPNKDKEVQDKFTVSQYPTNPIIPPNPSSDKRLSVPSLIIANKLIDEAAEVQMIQRSLTMLQIIVSWGYKG
jgi:hypothetical protein